MVTTQTNSVQIENLSPEIQKLREGYVDQENQFVPYLENREKYCPLLKATRNLSPLPCLEQNLMKLKKMPSLKLWTRQMAIFLRPQKHWE